VAINRFIVLETHGKLHPLIHTLVLPFSIMWHASVSSLLNDFAQVNSSIGEFTLAYPWT
jgi:hypothetical protein